MTYDCIEGGGTGLGAAPVVAAFAVSVAAFGTFLTVQASSAHPMVPLTLFRFRPVAISLAVAFITMAAFYGMVFLQSLHFQQQRGHSALVTGLLFLPITALVAVLSNLAPRSCRSPCAAPGDARLMPGATEWRQRVARGALDRTEIMVLAIVDAESGTWRAQSSSRRATAPSCRSCRTPAPGTAGTSNVTRASRSRSTAGPAPRAATSGCRSPARPPREAIPSGGWQRYTVRPAEVWFFDSRIDHERHRISTR